MKNKLAFLLAVASIGLSHAQESIVPPPDWGKFIIDASDYKTKKVNVEIPSIPDEGETRTITTEPINLGLHQKLHLEVYHLIHHSDYSIYGNLPYLNTTKASFTFDSESFSDSSILKPYVESGWYSSDLEFYPLNQPGIATLEYCYEKVTPWHHILRAHTFKTISTKISRMIVRVPVIVGNPQDIPATSPADAADQESVQSR